MRKDKKSSVQNTTIETVCGEDRMETAQPSPYPKNLDWRFTAHGRMEHIKCRGDDGRLYEVSLSAHEDTT